MNRASIFEWHKRFKECRESARDDERCGRSSQVNRPKLIGQRVRVRVRDTMLREFRKRLRRKRPALFELRQWHFHQDNTPVHNSILVTGYLTKMGVKTVRHPPYSTDIALCDFWLFPVVMRQLRWKILWRRSLTRSHKKTFMGPSRSCWNGTTNALQPKEITSKWTRVSRV